MALNSHGYDTSPQAASVPLSTDDIDWLLQNGKPIFKDTSRRAQFLSRVKNTLQMYRTGMNDLHREINRLQSELSAPGVSSGALDALTAARYLSDEQKEQLFTGSMKQAWTALLRLRADTARLRAQANSDLGVARFALTTVLEDPSVSDELRSRVRRLAEQLPAPAAIELTPIDSPLPGTPSAPGWQVEAAGAASAASAASAPARSGGDTHGTATDPAAAAAGSEPGSGPGSGPGSTEDDLGALFS